MEQWEVISRIVGLVLYAANSFALIYHGEYTGAMVLNGVFGAILVLRN